MRRQPKSKRLHIRIPPKLHDALIALAEERDHTTSRIVRDLIRGEVKRGPQA